jgi:endonuclease YncB( thermonuclease family)
MTHTKFFFAVVTMVSIAMHGALSHAADYRFELRGKVIHVDDGDTVVLLDEGKKRHKIRLTDIDAPETPKDNQGRAGQPFSNASSRNLASLAKGRNATALCYEQDHYERAVCRLMVDGRDLNLEQVRAGLAWANASNSRYVRDARVYQYEKEARQAKRGLWADPKPVAPWVWRKACWNAKQCDGAGS